MVMMTLLVSISDPQPVALSRPPQAKSCVCHMCGAHLNRLHSCLSCVFFGCFTKKHIHEHAKNKRHNLGKMITCTTNRYNPAYENVTAKRCVAVV